MDEMYFTIAGCSHYFGNDFMEKGMKVNIATGIENDATGNESSNN